MGRGMMCGKHTGTTFTGTLEDGQLTGEFTNCNFTALSMRGVKLTGTFKGCDFRPAGPEIAREEIAWKGDFDANCRGVASRR